MAIIINKIDYYIQKALLYTLLICLPVCVVKQVHAQSLQDTCKSVVAGTVLALGANTLCEYISTLGHEVGHAVTNKFLTGDPIDISIECSPTVAVRCLQPFVGRADYYSDTHKMGKGLRTAAGPLTGLALTQAQLLGIAYLENSIKKQNNKIAVQPFGFLKDLYITSKNTTDKLLSKNNTRDSESASWSCTTGDVAFALLKFLRCSRLVGEVLYGFTPIAVPHGIGDGQHLWSLALNRSGGNYPEINLNLLGLTCTIMAAPALAGVGKAVINKLQEHLPHKKHNEKK